ncbi:cysteine dioxygenase type 1-like [Dysidea avara]|uniref:cysteine dioxygenase type 1-like n=1 Tax=Dysidea avara TaxID=196820 RepID=UPI003332C0ED
MACSSEYTWQELLSTLTELFSYEEVDADKVIKVMSGYKSDPRDWAQYAMFDPHRYTRNLVDRGNGRFNLIVLCWGEGHGSSIHDHANSHCFMKMLQGSLKETQYHWPNNNKRNIPLDEKFATHHNIDDVTYINDSIGLHRVENSSHTEGAISLHLYSPPFQMCQTFDERTGHQRSCKVIFHSEKGLKCIPI